MAATKRKIPARVLVEALPQYVLVKLRILVKTDLDIIMMTQVNISRRFNVSYVRTGFMKRVEMNYVFYAVYVRR